MKGGHMSNPFENAVWVLPIPNDCRMIGEFEVGHTVPHITISDGDRDVRLLLQRDVLDRLVRLSQQMLAVPENNDTTVPPVILESTLRGGIRVVPTRRPAQPATFP
jgi:hypothetical protein